MSALWRFIYTGRPVAPPGRDTVYISDDDASWVSWWSLAEVRLLRRSLPSWTVICATVGADVLDEMSEHVLASMRGALEAAEESGCGLVVTAF